MSGRNEAVLACEVGATGRSPDTAEFQPKRIGVAGRLARDYSAVSVPGDKRPRPSTSTHWVEVAKQEEAVPKRFPERPAVGKANAEARCRSLRHTATVQARKISGEPNPAPHPGSWPDARDGHAAESKTRLLEALTPAASVGGRNPENHRTPRAMDQAGLTRSGR